MQTKLRIIRPAQPKKGYEEVWGITIPKNTAIFFKNTRFVVSKTNEGILLQSGTYFKDKKEIDLEKYKI